MSEATTMAKRDGLANVIRRGDVLDEWQRQLIGPSGQLRIPMRDQIDLRRCAAILRELANRMEILSHVKTGEFSALLQTKGEIRAAQSRLQSQTASGKKNSG